MVFYGEKNTPQDLVAVVSYYGLAWVLLINVLGL